MSLTTNEKLGRAMSQLPRVDTFPFRSALYQSYSEQDAFNGVTGANVLLALNRAREARELAVSWRDFKVGAAVVSFCLDPPVMQVLSGINIKPDEDGGSINIHAEQLALQKMKDSGGDVVPLIAVVGELQPDTQSGMLADTLHPCGLCRDALDSSGFVDDVKTIIVSALPDLRTLEFYSFGALKKFHEESTSQGIYSVRLPELELLTPFAPESYEPHRLQDSPKIRAEEEIWRTAVEFPLLQYRLNGTWPE